ncbi:ABC transporter ATP-binding protein [Enterococcus olivae]
MNSLSVNGITKHYPNFILQDIDFSVKPGRIMGLIGKNGAGKSTTLKAILNMIHVDSGKVEMFGKDFLQQEQSCKQQIGVVLGGIDFYKNKKLKDITAVTRQFYPNWNESLHQKYLQLFALDPQKRVKELSSGMKVKYLIAIALSYETKLLILDEPTSGLDPVSRDELLALFRQLVADGQRSILFSTHITSDLEKCADDITYIQQGKMIHSDEKEAFIRFFDPLKTEEEESLSLEEIMIRSERGTHGYQSII